MAQYVDYWANNVKFTEGPFVLCGGPVGASTGRIECEVKGHFCPRFVHPSISKLRDEKKDFGLKDRSAIVDRLNQMVKDCEIVLEGNFWVYPPLNQQ